MLKIKRFFVAMALALCLLIPSATVRAADVTTQMLNAFGMLVTGIAGPDIAYPFALDKDVWYFLVDNVMPSLSSEKEELRLIALSKTPKLKPPTTQPIPAAVNYDYVANGYTQVIVFGDSMSDNGNMRTVGMKLANWDIPASPPNYGGRFCDGPVILEIMSYILNRPLTNYSFAGAMSGRNNLIPAYGFHIGMLDEVDDFISNLGWKFADSKALYVIWTGPDDFYKGVNIFDPTVASAVTANIKSSMVKLYFRGARNFFVPLMPDISITPAARIHDSEVDGYLEAAHARSVELSSSLTAMLKSFAKRYPLAKVRTFDTFTVLSTEMQKYAALGYNTTDFCYLAPYMGLPGPVCDNPDEYLFWDQNHPTAWVNKIVGAYFADAAVGAALPSR